MELSMEDPKEYRFYAVFFTIISTVALTFGIITSIFLVIDFTLLMSSFEREVAVSDYSFKICFGVICFAISIITRGMCVSSKLKHQEAIAEKYSLHTQSDSSHQSPPESDTKS